jgi:hypothetical protein
METKTIITAFGVFILTVLSSFADDCAVLRSHLAECEKQYDVATRNAYKSVPGSQAEMDHLKTEIDETRRQIGECEKGQKSANQGFSRGKIMDGQTLLGNNVIRYHYSDGSTQDVTVTGLPDLGANRRPGATDQQVVEGYPEQQARKAKEKQDAYNKAIIEKARQEKLAKEKAAAKSIKGTVKSEADMTDQEKLQSNEKLLTEVKAKRDEVNSSPQEKTYSYQGEEMSRGRLLSELDALIEKIKNTNAELKAAILEGQQSPSQ